MARNKFDVDEDLSLEKEFKAEHLVRLAPFMKPYLFRITITMILMGISTALGLTSPFFLKMAIDNYIPNKDVKGIILISFATLAILIVNIFLARFRIVEMSKVGQSVIRDLRLALFEHLQELPFSYYDSRPHGKILVRVVNYINSLSDLLSNGVVNLFTDVLSLIIIVIIMLLMDVKLALVCMVGMPILLCIIIILKVKQRDAWRSNSTKQSNLNAYIHESISGVKISQGFVREEENKAIFAKLSNQVKDTWLRACKIMFLIWPSADNIGLWSTCALFVVGAKLMEFDSAVTVGMLVAFSAYVGRFWGPINNIANAYNAIIINMAYLERIFETLDEPVDVKDKENATELKPIDGKVRFDKVTFAYDEDHYILKDVDFDCNAGDTIALVGPTGAGKTTVVNLISRFYDINRGRILLDEEDIANVTLKSLRSQMGIMLQDSFIFAGTVMDNIRYSKLDATDEEVINAAKAVCAHDFILEMEKGYNTEVNERGSRLSVGQRQLISFARALLADPKILILDEATSSIDTKTEKALQIGLDRLLEGRTSFIIAHRLSTIKNATKIIYIAEGKILEEGNHDQLIKKQGAYYELYTAQYAFLDAM